MKRAWNSSIKTTSLHCLTSSIHCSSVLDNLLLPPELRSVKRAWNSSIKTTDGAFIWAVSNAKTTIFSPEPTDARIITATERYKGATNRRRVSRTEKPCHSFCKKRLACSRRTVLKDTRLLALERFYLNDSNQGSLVVDRAAPSSLNSFVDMD